MVRYGFIGLGAMGQRMAANIAQKLNASDTLSVFDIVSARATMGSPRNSPVEVVRNSDLIVTSLPEGKHVKAIFSEITPDLTEKKTFLDCSTIDVKTSLEVGEEVAAAGSKYIDTPVSGGTVGAENATLTFMVGQDAPEEMIHTALSMMGKRIFYCGNQGTGIAAKLANNYILALQNLATCEGFALANKLGLDLNRFAEIVSVSSAQSWSSSVNNPVPGVNASSPSSNNYNGGFATKLMLKDLKLALDSAELGKLSLELGKTAPSIYNCADQEKDFSVYYEQLVK